MPYRNPPAHEQHMENECSLFSKDIGGGAGTGVKIMQTLGYTQNRVPVLSVNCQRAVYKVRKDFAFFTV